MQFISAKDLAARLGRVLVVDVRSYDKRGGRIRGARSVPIHSFNASAVVDEALAEGVEAVVFHCMFSQERGPKAARYCAQEVERRGGGVDVLVLEGGFQGWIREFLGNVAEGDMFEGLDKDYWLENMGRS